MYCFLLAAMFNGTKWDMCSVFIQGHYNPFRLPTLSRDKVGRDKVGIEYFMNLLLFKHNDYKLNIELFYILDGVNF